MNRSMFVLVALFCNVYRASYRVATAQVIAQRYSREQYDSEHKSIYEKTCKEKYLCLEGCFQFLLQKTDKSRDLFLCSNTNAECFSHVIDGHNILSILYHHNNTSYYLMCSEEFSQLFWIRFGQLLHSKSRQINFESILSVFGNYFITDILSKYIPIARNSYVEQNKMVSRFILGFDGQKPIYNTRILSNGTQTTLNELYESPYSDNIAITI